MARLRSVGVVCAVAVVAAMAAGCKKAREWEGTATIGYNPAITPFTLGTKGSCGPNTNRPGFTLFGAVSSSIEIVKTSSGELMLKVTPPAIDAPDGKLTMSYIEKSDCTKFDVVLEDQGTKDSDGMPEWKGHIRADCKDGASGGIFKADLEFKDCR